MTEVINEETLAENANTPQSPFEALRAQRDEVASRREVLIPIPNYEGTGLKAKYRMLDRTETDEIAKAVRKLYKERSEFMYYVVLDTAIAGLEGFYLAPGMTPDDEASPLRMDEDDPNSPQITSYVQLAERMGWDRPENAGNRMAMWWVFGENEFAAGSHGLAYQRWLNNTTAEVDDEYLRD